MGEHPRHKDCAVSAYASESCNTMRAVEGPLTSTHEPAYIKPTQASQYGWQATKPISIYKTECTTSS
eukprot:3473675-Amphidinium_carterae.1